MLRPAHGFPTGWSSVLLPDLPADGSGAGAAEGEVMTNAILSIDQKYRYSLTRDLGMVGEGACCFVMLNPSTADATQDDQTIRRCIGYARSFGCWRLEVVNLFAYRSTDPNLLYGMSRDVAVGPENDWHIRAACLGSRIVVCAWGNHGSLFGRATEVLAIIRGRGATPMALKINNKSQQPAHPLYLRADAKFTPYKPIY